MKYKLIGLWYKLIRRWVLAYDAFMKVDKNEDFTCGYCLKPVLRRCLFCSEGCYFTDLSKQLEEDVKNGSI